MVPLQFLILAGPTASGKSELAVRIAEQLHTEIVGADAYQIYQGFDILSGKPDPSLLARVPHHLIGVLASAEDSDAARYAGLATNIIEKLNARGHIPLVVGGTGFYLKGLTHPLPDLPGRNPDLRAEFASKPVSLLLAELRQRDPVTFDRVDRQNRRRVERALEVCRLTGRPFSSFDRSTANVKFFALWLNWPRDELYTRVDFRVDRMLKTGAIEEVVAAGPTGTTASQMIGLAEIRQYLRNKITLAQCAEAMKTATRRYAKRQVSWFRAQPYMPIAPDLPLAAIVELYRGAVIDNR
ncbi:MAG TPA: tRNA (adenosine(37)-N6)-dimethylallyltransferase MiaA [Chthoniobacterales bacterium]|nr:tRNA (adenosine(37)-N6)-dimethylallyltransferase MiaA [Chthoniobacterales bacterium]